jgi:DNA-binding CsgD family transcriptional regulator
VVAGIVVERHDTPSKIERQRHLDTLVDEFRRSGGARLDVESEDLGRQIERGAGIGNVDAAGRFLLAANAAGRMLWCTPQAGRLLGGAYSPAESDGFLLPPTVQAWLRGRARDRPAAEPTTIATDIDEQRLQFSYVGQIGPDEFLLRLTEGQAAGDETVLRQRLALTPREADVLSWIARGKSNRDIGEILGLSPRTVNKHLEQVYAKLGVENRAAAAALAVRILADAETR